jgi:putative ABC transport system substrate-binding protein
MSTRRELNAALAANLLVPAIARSQLRAPRLGWLLGSSPRSALFNVAFERGLAGLGYIDGKSLVIDDVFADGMVERFAPLARGLVARNPTAKRLELLRELLPSAHRVAVLAEMFTVDQLEIARRTARLPNLELRLVELHDYPYDYASSMSEARTAHSEAMLVLMSPRMFPGRERLAAELRKHELPAVFGLTQYVDAGGLASYGASLEALFTRVAYFVDKIIKGASPSTLPMEQPTVLDLAVNLKTARAFGVHVPQSILLRATTVVE